MVIRKALYRLQLCFPFSVPSFCGRDAGLGVLRLVTICSRPSFFSRLVMLKPECFGYASFACQPAMIISGLGARGADGAVLDSSSVRFSPGLRAAVFNN